MRKTSILSLAAVSAFALGACATTAAEAPSTLAAASETAGKTYNHNANYEKKGEHKKHDKAPKHISKGGGHSKMDFLNAYDSNEDGAVTLAEYQAVRNEGYAARDPNADAKVVADEYVAEYEVRLDQDLAAQRDRQIKQAYVRFGILDADKDGVLTLAEFQSSGKRMFDRLDTNKDGVVNDADTKKAY